MNKKVDKTKKEKIPYRERKNAEILERNRLVINYNRLVAKELAERRKPKHCPKDSFISLQRINKIYDNLVQAVNDFNLDIKKNEFIVLVGPSGCGKSTTLRMIAGLEDITAGDLYINGVHANSLSPNERNLAMVFQSYALYPHMNVFDNMAYSLKIKKYLVPEYDEKGNPVMGTDEEKIRKLTFEKARVEMQYKNIRKYNFSSKEIDETVNKLKETLDELTRELTKAETELVPLKKKRKLSKTEIDETVRKTAKILQIEEYLDRKPKALSGGQRQRVALGRAIVKSTPIFLMDEPLSNLDAKLRVNMRSEIKLLHKKINTTTVYVTHDQVEAMTMADRIVIMNNGLVQQIGEPKAIYNHPKNVFVATFIGSPAMNIFNGTIKDDKIAISDSQFINLEKGTSSKLSKYFERKISEIDEFISTGLQKEYESELNVKREALILQMEQGKYRGKQNPLLNLSLSQEEKEVCDSLFSNRCIELNKLRDVYQKMVDKKEFNILFGVRPEDIYLDGSPLMKEVKQSNTFEVQSTIPELLGNEYYVHARMLDKDFILKTNANNELNENQLIKIVVDLNKVHFFDKESENIID